MSLTEKPVLISSILSVLGLARFLFIGFDGAGATAAAAAYGITNADTGANEMAPVGVLGEFIVTAGGIIAAGAEVEVGADNKAVTIAAGVSQGRALDAAAADGDLIRVLRGIN